MVDWETYVDLFLSPHEEDLPSELDDYDYQLAESENYVEEPTAEEYIDYERELQQQISRWAKEEVKL